MPHKMQSSILNYVCVCVCVNVCVVCRYITFCGEHQTSICTCGFRLFGPNVPDKLNYGTCQHSALSAKAAAPRETFNFNYTCNCNCNTNSLMKLFSQGTDGYQQQNWVNKAVNYGLDENLATHFTRKTALTSGNCQRGDCNIRCQARTA